VLGQITDRRKDFQTDGKIELAEDRMKLKTTQSGKTGSMINRSAILSHGKSWTIVPKEAVRDIPKNFASRVNGKREGKLVSWREFLAKNRVWLQLPTPEVKFLSAKRRSANIRGPVESWWQFVTRNRSR